MPEATVTLELESLLRFSISQGISDIHLKPGRPPVFRRSQSTELAGAKSLEILDTADIQKLFDGVMDEHHRVLLRERGNVDIGWGVTGVGRLRINVFRSRMGLQSVIRIIPARIPTFQDLGLPRVFPTIAGERRGLILVTGAAGQGKTTTLAALADHVNRTRPAHIVTIEDPIEFVLEDRRSIITQREVLTDTPSFEAGLRAALRQDPDVIIVGEMRDRETAETALQAAETGHLVLSTLHTVDVQETVNRILSFFDKNEQAHARMMLSSVLRAVVSMRLVTRKDGQGRVPAVEVMVVTARIRDLLRSEEGQEDISIAMAQGHSQYGMQTFDQALMGLLRDDRITYEEAMTHATNPADFALRVKGIGGGSESDPYRTTEEPFGF
jgi:twitching motility protein PilT